MTRKLGHRDIVLLCILGAAVAAELLDRSGAWRVAGVLLLAAAVIVTIASYLNQLRTNVQNVDNRLRPGHSSTSHAQEAFSMKQFDLLAAAVSSRNLLVATAKAGNRRKAELTSSAAARFVEEWEPSFEVHVAGDKWEKSWNYVGRVPNPSEFVDLLLDPGLEPGTEGLKVRVSKLVHIRENCMVKDPALEDLWKSWKALDQLDSQRSPRLRKHSPSRSNVAVR